MYLQGNLQTVFDALYHMGVIDPVLKMDWNRALDEMQSRADDISRAVNIANLYQDDLHELVVHLKELDNQTLSYLAMEVAREYADYHARETLH